MEILDNNSHIRCELGVCKNRADHAVKFEHAGIRSRLYMCDKCMRELYAAIGATVVPKSLETAKRKRSRTEEK